MLNVTALSLQVTKLILESRMAAWISSGFHGPVCCEEQIPREEPLEAETLETLSIQATGGHGKALSAQLCTISSGLINHSSLISTSGSNSGFSGNRHLLFL